MILQIKPFIIGVINSIFFSFEPCMSLISKTNIATPKYPDDIKAIQKNHLFSTNALIILP